MSALDNLQIATPCPMKWSNMKGDDRKRRCERCRLDVYNLSKLPEREATELISKKVCVTFLRRADGTVITGDCRGGFSAHFWEKFGSMERTGLILLFGAVFTALFFATVITIFGDNIRWYFGAGATGAIAAGPVSPATRSPKPLPHGTITSRAP
jgi:hypothetical protein